MDPFTDQDIEGKVIDHHGLVAATIDRLGLIKKIDKLLPVSKKKGAKTTHGQRIAAMILNGLGFVDQRLYMFPEFLENKPVERLLGRGIKAEDFNDDVLGRALDTIYDYGITRLFSDLAFSIGIEQGLLGKSAHFDTSTLSVHGEYDLEPSEETSPIPKYGYSKDHRPDLKQMVINLATTGAAGFPIWMEAHSGNASDQKVLKEAAERMQHFTKQLEEAPSFLYVADSAMYESCVNKAGSLLWLSRVPERSTVAKAFIEQEEVSWMPLDDNYKIFVTTTSHFGVKQRWCLVYSQDAHLREVKTLEKKLKKEEALYIQALRRLSNQVFNCKSDALKEAERFTKALKYHTATFEVEEVQKYEKKGRPKQGETPHTVGYRLQGTLLLDTLKVDAFKRTKGRFILATNELDSAKLPDREILSLYKEQAKTESGFKFLKDDAFEVSSIYLKKPSRIVALMMVMTLCLMVYSFAQHHLRQSLIQARETLPNQLGKPTQKPTMKRIFKLFEGVQVLTISFEDRTQELVINLKPILKQIVMLFGEKAMEVYSIS